MKATRTGTLISEESKINAMLADQTLIYLGYQKALKAVQVNGTSMVVIDTICALLVDARDKRGA
jgi:hypothetical protein